MSKCILLGRDTHINQGQEAIKLLILGENLSNSLISKLDKENETCDWSLLSHPRELILQGLTCSSRSGLSERVFRIGWSMMWMMPLAAGRSAWTTVYCLLGSSIRMNLFIDGGDNRCVSLRLIHWPGFWIFLNQDHWFLRFLLAKKFYIRGLISVIFLAFPLLGC